MSANLKEVIAKAEQGGYALGHFNISDITALKAITRAARELNVPVIIGTSEGETDFIGIKNTASLIKNIREETGQEIFLNADHMRTLEGAVAAASAGYDMVIFDAAHLPIDENIAKTREAVSAIKSINPNILVEGELGYIGTSSKLLEDIPEGAAVSGEHMTLPEDAKRFIAETGVDLLAPAVGNIHGMLKNAANPALDISRIKDVRSAAGVPLVLHGGSGVSDEDFLAAIDAGVAIVHINTELRVAWRKGVQDALSADSDEIAPYKILAKAEAGIYEVALKRLQLFSRL